MDNLSDLQDVALVVGPVAAAIAAIASLLSVRQTRKIARDATLPDLAVQATYDPRTGQVGTVVHNAGGGAVRGLNYVITYEDKTSFNPAGDGILRANEKLSVVTQIVASGPIDEGACVMLVGRDRYGFAHEWTHTEDHDVLRSRLLRRPVYGHVLPRFRKRFGVDPEALTRVRAGVTVKS